MWLAVWVPIALITGLHYAAGHEHMWAHGVLRRVYYLPIILAAFRAGLKGGIAASILTTVVYVPHAFTALNDHRDPAPTLEKASEIVLYNCVAAVAGYLAGLERRRRAQLLRALEEQRQLTEQLARAGRLSALGQLVAGIAHEIKNPLHALQGTAEIIDAVIPAGCEERHMWLIHRRELSRLEDISMRFLSFARPREPDLVEIDLRDVARHLVDLVDAEARSHNIDVQLDLTAAADPVRVLGDRDQLVQIGLNIALNAVRALADCKDGHIRVAVSCVPTQGRDHARWVIENNGPQIPDAVLETLFNPFFSGHDEGTGLGLSICSRIAEHHRGWISGENAGLGVRFSLFLPLSDHGSKTVD